MVPTHMFLTKGVGIHKEKLTSFEEALRSAGIAYCNLVSVSSILPPDAKIIPRKRAKTLFITDDYGALHMNCVLAWKFEHGMKLSRS